jgi:acetyltransferase-like isoleucine patch superfamily enzyme
MSEKLFFKHPSAIVDDRAVIGEKTSVWVNVQIRENVEIGSHCVISKDVYIDTGVKIGNYCKIQNGVSVYHGVTVEDKVFLGPNASFTNDKIPRAFNADWQITKTLIKEGSSVGANATIVCGVTLGEYCMVAAGAVVTKNVEPYTLVMGNPARPYARIDKMGNIIEKL